MVSLPFIRLINPRIGIGTRPSEVFHMPYQVPLSILHPEISEVCPSRYERYRHLTGGSPLNRQPLDKNKPTSIKHLIQ